VREHLRSGTEVLDGLRGLAIVLVVLYHTWLFSWLTPDLHLWSFEVPLPAVLRTGSLGVELFFTISAFVLFFPHAERALGGGAEQGLGDFAYRRFIKIVPSYFLVLAATTIVTFGTLPAAQSVLSALAMHVLFIPNFFIDPLGQNNSVFWSLGVEVQFYLVFPLLAWGFRRWPLGIALAMTVVALGYRYAVAPCCLQLEPVNRQVPAFLDVFAGGMLAAYGVVWIRRRFPSIHNYAWIFTIGALAAGCFWFTLIRSLDDVFYAAAGREHWLLAFRTLLAFTMAAFVFCSCLAMRFWRALIANRVLVFLSLISYNLYLWHTLVMIWMWKHGVPRAATTDPHADEHWKPIYILSSWAVVLAISIAVTYFFERPLLGTVRPHPFAFDWSRLLRRLRPMPARPIASSETSS